MRSALAIAVLLLGALTVTGCAGPSPSQAVISAPAPTTGSSAGPATSPSPVDSGDPVDPSPGIDPCAEPDASPATDGGVVVDPRLLEILPASVDGVAIRPCPAAVADIVDPPAEVEAMAIALYPGSEGVAVATVSRIEPGVVDDDWFRAWRDSIDADVCERAGGVDVGRSQLEIGSLLVHRATCVEGVATYHARLPDDVVVFVQGTLPADLGRRVMESVAE
jgi:hypothetical protein